MRSDENAARETARGDHSVELSGHKLFAVTGVRSVTSFTDKQVEIELDGERLLLTGCKIGCGECQSSCQSACKTSCTVGNQSCKNNGEKVNVVRKPLI